MFHLEAFVPAGLIFASPMLIAVIKKRVPLFNMTALLPIRIAECILGRVNMVKLGVSIPAHFAGCLLGIVVFRTCVPYVPFEVLTPISYTTSFYSGPAPDQSDAGSMLSSLYTLLDSRNFTAFGDLIGAVLVVFIYTLLNLILPQILYVNKLPNQVLSAVLLPVMLWRVGGSCSSFHPVAQYCLWYLASPESTQLSPTAALLQSFNATQVEETVAAATAAAASDDATAALGLLSETFDLAALTSVENLTEFGQNTISSITSMISDVNTSLTGGRLLADMLTSINSATNSAVSVPHMVPTLQVGYGSIAPCLFIVYSSSHLHFFSLYIASARAVPPHWRSVGRTGMSEILP